MVAFKYFFVFGRLPHIQRNMRQIEKEVL